MPASTRSSSSIRGYNPSGSFKDNGMTGRRHPGRQARHAARRLRLHRQHVGLDGRLLPPAGGQQAVIFLPHGKIAYGKLAQALEFGAVTIQVEANFDQILTLVRKLADEIGIYLLNSINPFRIEGQKSIGIELNGPARLEGP